MLTDWIPLTEWRQLPKVCGLYIIRHTTSNKEYVGISQRIRTRVGVHARAVLPYYLHRALRQHSVDQFEVAVLCLAPRSELPSLEILTIGRRGTYAPEGYNTTRGGDGMNAQVWTEEARAGAAERQRSRRASDETKAKMSASQQGRGLRPRLPAHQVLKMSLTRKGIPTQPCSPETKEKIRASLTGKPRPQASGNPNHMAGMSRGLAPRAREVLAWRLGSLTPETHACVADAAEAFGVASSQVSVWAAGKTRPRSGVVFAYAK